MLLRPCLKESASPAAVFGVAWPPLPSRRRRPERVEYIIELCINVGAGFPAAGCLLCLFLDGL